MNKLIPIIAAADGGHDSGGSLQSPSASGGSHESGDSSDDHDTGAAHKRDQNTPRH